MTIEDKAGKTLADLGVQDEAGARTLFEEARRVLDSEEPLAQGADEDWLKSFHDRWHSRKHGLLTLIGSNWLKGARRDFMPVVGREFNQLRLRVAEIESIAQHARTVRGEVNATRAGHVDLTLPGYRRELGSIHPITRVRRELEDIFLGLGFRIETGPEIESVYNNFDALNIPETHPSRDDWDTLYIDAETLLRTHTSPVQIRAMRKYGAPLYIITPGKCYRNENPDATHSAMFHQLEGLAVDTDISFADLKGTLDFFAKKFFGEKTRTRLQPSFFPFTEPSGEMAASCPFCEGRGCRTCKESGWIELMGCGMVHPEVLSHGGIDPDHYSGWAFGLGIDRFAMLKYDIGEIHHFFQSDVRFLSQF